MNSSTQQFDDSQIRQQALSVDQSFIVQAPAGSGKTSLLVYRILSLLLTVERPEQVLAITFTKKATAEMRQRVIEMLEMAERGEQGSYPLEQYALDVAQQVLQRNNDKGWHLLDSPQQLQILTIDSFCAKLTTDMPWLSRLGDKPRTTEKAEEHYSAAVEQLMNCLLDHNSALSQSLQTVMASLDFNYQLARKLFIEMLGKRDQWLRHLLQQDETVLKNELQDTWQQVSETHLLYLQSLIPTDTQQQLLELGKSASEVLSQQDKNENIFAELDQYPQLPRRLDLTLAKAFKRLLLTNTKPNNYRKKIDARAGFVAKSDEKEELLSLLQDYQGDKTLQEALIELDILPAKHFSETDWQELMALKEVLIALAGFLQLRFRATGEVDFNEVTQRANLALSELQQPTDLALRLDYQIQHILVDEFQDTSHSQVELLKKLTVAWDHASESQSNTLFLVGDPMQSIYRFREADVGLFLRVADDALKDNAGGVFDNLRLQSLTLSENFRSNQSLVEWFNDTFAASFPARNDVMQGAIAYSQASSRKQHIDQPVHLQIAHDKAQEVNALVGAVQTALRELREQDSKVAILVQARSQLATLLPALQKADIEYMGVDLQTLDATPAIIDIVSLCRALSRLDDRVAWLALLRGPWCGMTLVEMKQLIQSDVDSDVWSLLEAKLPKDPENKPQSHPSISNSMTNFMRVMAAALAQKGRVSLHALTHWAWQQLGGQATLGDTAQEDAELVFSLLSELEQGGDLDSVASLEKSLEALYAKSQNTQASVVISTMHKAKGLQYDTVILPSLNRKAPNLSKSMMVWAEEVDDLGHSKMLMAGYRLISQQGSHYDYLQALEKKREQHQTMRLMYVACTRAERKLVLMANLGFDKHDNIKAPMKNSLLATVWTAVQESAELLPNNQLDSEDEPLSQSLYRLRDDFELQLPEPVQWQGQQQLLGKQDEGDDDYDIDYDIDYEMEFEWATSLATAVGVVLHDWLQVYQSEVMQITFDDALQRHWRAALLAQRLPVERLSVAIERLKLALKLMQQDDNASFIFNDYQEQQNEYALATFEDSLVKTYRIDRTFVDNQSVRWIIDYKTTYTEQSNTSQFVDQQMPRHKEQLQKYGALMSTLDERPIKLGVYFPLLKEFRSWDYQR